MQRATPTIPKVKTTLPNLKSMFEIQPKWEYVSPSILGNTDKIYFNKLAHTKEGLVWIK